MTLRIYSKNARGLANIKWRFIVLNFIKIRSVLWDIDEKGHLTLYRMDSVIGKYS
jgi:hypothetical protein